MRIPALAALLLAALPLRAQDAGLAADPRLCFPGGRLKAVTLSFDDGRIHDVRLVEALNRHGLRGTFHLVGGLLDGDGYVKKADVAALYAGHEIASHTLTHAILPRCTDAELSRQVLEDRRELERLAGYPVRGFAYPGGEYDARVAAALPKLGLRYARVVGTHHGFGLPTKPFEWAATCSIGDMLVDGRRFLESATTPALLFVWGHSYEFDERKCWNLVDEFGTLVGKRPELWYATNIEVIDYLDAARRIEASADGLLLRNPSAVSVWVVVGGRPREIKPGETAKVG